MRVNLEKQLLASNKKIATPDELLQIKEYDRLGAEFADSEVLDRVGINGAAKEGKRVKERMSKLKRDALCYDHARVFHISQIENICRNYHLRFLPAGNYKGSVCLELPAKISQFEIANNVQCTSMNSYIIAPASSFRLEEKPKDPLFFYKINSEYYYLIHKWGNDLSVFRRFLGLCGNRLFCLILPAFIMFFIGLFIQSKEMFVAWSVAYGLIVFINTMHVLIERPWCDSNNWNSSFE